MKTDDAIIREFAQMLAEDIIEEKIASGELIRLDHGGLIKADLFDPTMHIKAQLDKLEGNIDAALARHRVKP